MIKMEKNKLIKKVKKDIIPKKKDLEINAIIHNKKLGLALYETFQIIEKKIRTNYLEKFLSYDKDKQKEIIILKSNKLTELIYANYSIMLSPYYLKRIIEFFHKKNYVVSDRLVNENNIDGELIIVNRRTIIINYLKFYYELNSFKYYLYKILLSKNLILKDSKIEDELVKINLYLEKHFNSSIEEAIKSLYNSNHNQEEIVKNDGEPDLVSVNENDIKEEVEAQINSEKNKTKQDSTTNEILGNDDDEEEDLEFPSNGDKQ